ncbi:MAG: hypothetical protein HY658_12180 [Actinobacteria bacterium]|nr:hypothetical protein [Actinomycetota bacterium]
MVSKHRTPVVAWVRFGLLILATLMFATAAYLLMLAATWLAGSWWGWGVSDYEQCCSDLGKRAIAATFFGLLLAGGGLGLFALGRSRRDASGVPDSDPHPG